ncbi:MAG TPA: thaumatin family protein [Candidatus Binatia bacterium]|nr:thaumatin family protein [Candidatus Binatia bacterium]
MRRAAFEATLPVPVPAAPGRYVVQLVNESSTTLLAAANAAHKVDEAPTAVLPREGRWDIPPGGVLTIDIPTAWEHTIGAGAVGPVFWARTGCRFDAARDLAQCETGSCSGIYDCSKANQSAPGPKALAEWTFDDDNHRAAPDVSVVDGVNLNMDIEALGPRTVHVPSEPHWLDHSLTTCGGDLRDPAICPAGFLLKRSELSTFIQGTPGGDDPVACFSNCGKYKYPLEPELTCDPNPATDPRCYYWKSFCCAFPVPGTSPYGVSCGQDGQCAQNGGCWNNGDGQSVCACRAFIEDATCPPDVCTFPYSPQTPSNQPPFGHCSDVTGATGDPAACIGDDTVHRVMPYGLTWPNDPETLFSDAHAYRIVLAPGGTTIPITPSGPIDACSNLPAAYGYAQAASLCSGVADRVYAGARLAPASWDCRIGDGIATNGVLCRW